MAAHVTRDLEVIRNESYQDINPEIVQVTVPQPPNGNEEVDQWIDEYRQADYREIGIDIA